jgi:hypothetical protein
MLAHRSDQVNCSTTVQSAALSSPTKQITVSTIGDLACKYEIRSEFGHDHPPHSPNLDFLSPALHSGQDVVYLAQPPFTSTPMVPNTVGSTASAPPSPLPPRSPTIQIKWADCDTIDMLPKAMSFTWFDIVLDLFSIFCYILDVVSDVVTAYVHYYTKNWTFFHLTVFFIAVPSMITTMISLRW